VRLLKTSLGLVSLLSRLDDLSEFRFEGSTTDESTFNNPKLESVS